MEIYTILQCNQILISSNHLFMELIFFKTVNSFTFFVCISLKTERRSKMVSKCFFDN